LISNITYPELIYPPDKSENIDTTFSFRWRKHRLAIAYDFELSKENFFEDPILKWTNLPDTLIQITGLSRDITYYWRVCPVWEIESDEIFCSYAEFTTGKKSSVSENDNSFELKLLGNTLQINDSAFEPDEFYAVDYLARKINYRLLNNFGNIELELNAGQGKIIIFYKGRVFKFILSTNHN